jgi:hypothetical protein
LEWLVLPNQTITAPDCFAEHLNNNAVFALGEEILFLKISDARVKPIVLGMGSKSIRLLAESGLKSA